MSQKTFVFNLKKEKRCSVCGQTKLMCRRQKTCDDCKEEGKEKDNGDHD